MIQMTTEHTDLAIAILDADARVPWGFFAAAAAADRFPSQALLNEFLRAGQPASGPEGSTGWTPFALDPDEFLAVKAWWLGLHPASIEDDLGARTWKQWQIAVLSGDDWGDDGVVPQSRPEPAAVVTPEVVAAEAIGAPADVASGGEGGPATPLAGLQPADLPLAFRCPFCSVRTIRAWHLLPRGPQSSRCSSCKRIWKLSFLAVAATIGAAICFLLAASLASLAPATAAGIAVAGLVVLGVGLLTGPIVRQ